MGLLLAYCWVGSAGTAPLLRWFPRTTFEKTEMEWFAWWPFRLLISLLVFSLATATIRQVRRDLLRLGVWIVHAGVLVLIAGSAVYFSSKVEGDMLVFRRQAVLGVPGGKQTDLTVQPGARTYVYGRDMLYEVRVESINPDYELLTGEDRGRKTFAVQLFVRPVVRGVPGTPFVRQLLSGYPQYTEDVLPGQGRAVKVTGSALVDTELKAELTFAPEDRIHLRDRPALHVRTAGQNEWAVLPLRGLPRYRERVTDPEAVWTEPGERAATAARWSLEPRPARDSAPMEGVSVRVTGYLPYARLEDAQHRGAGHGGMGTGHGASGNGRGEAGAGHGETAADSVATGARKGIRPLVIPRAERDAKAGATYSLVEVEVSRAGESKKVWLRYSHYAHPSRYGYFPQKVSLAGGRPIEIVYSRETRRLPEAVALESFRLETYPGQTRERDYVSLVRFLDQGRWSEPREIRSNHPSGRRGWWYFQATWDPPSPRMQYAGLNHSGLGVGNRHGIGLMMLGSVLTIAGTAWSFYLKPVLIERRRRRGFARIGRPKAGERHGAVPLSASKACLAFVAGSLALGAPASARETAGVPLSVPGPFVEALDLRAFRLTAVQDEGRLKTFDSMAHEKMKRVNGSAAFRSVDATVRYLDMMLVPEHYRSASAIHVRKKAVRRQIAQEIRGRNGLQSGDGAVSGAALDRLVETGLVSPEFIDDPAVEEVLSELERDLMRTSKDVQALRAARSLADAHALHGMWRGVPPPGGDEIAPWLSVASFAAARADSGRVHPMGAPGGLDPSLAASIGNAWARLRSGWRSHDAAAVNGAADDLARLLPRAEPRLYPPESRRRAESWYYRNGKLTGAWIVYFLALPFLLMTLVYRLRWARVAGLALFGSGFALHTFSIALRWMLAGRIPNSNMFEAIVASSWLGGAVAIALEVALRRRAVRGLPALAASAYAMTAMMFGHFMPAALNSDIVTVMPILDRTIWLYIHTNMVIASYALIFFGAVTALLYLGGRAARGLMPASAFGAAWSGGASPEDAGLSRALDGATMIFLQLAFLMLWTGTILGAVWANVSWGRPWGWDPKEVFALNTWIVFLVLVHVRMRVRDKALWTAVLAVIGCGVMLFNWIAVNFVIVGLHSYA